MIHCRSSFELTTAAIDSGELTAAFSDDRAGACVVFEGRVRNRNEGKAVTALEYEAYAQMAGREGNRVIEEALERFDVIAARAVHRVGRLAIGEVAVWIAVLAGHRDEGFAACRFLIDEIKARVPIWKREHYATGAAEWVDPTGQAGRRA